ncbi:hypothetical protein H4W79_002491 [Nocardiopsis terrae]|uniref:HTH merR-type domain-containing protein n=1 Tax=Nocardiopsis terrae TaxID=372655 RepID=A0ABR9HGY1_9ACTN|nr:MerR family transcriptional regulator [Nocardiopsis terrae]MBE1458277.1 hypothetical protein [Nocardiopsis terrae]
MRLYERSGLLVPHRVEGANGYRYYLPEQVGAAVRVRELRRMDMPLAMVAQVVAAPPQEAVGLVAEVARGDCFYPRIMGAYAGVEEAARKRGVRPVGGFRGICVRGSGWESGRRSRGWRGRCGLVGESWLVERTVVWRSVL